MEYNKEIEDILEELKSSKEGLSNKDAKNRLERYGKNVFPSKKRDSIFKIFFKELTSPIEIVLIFTVLISFFIGEVVDA